MAVPFHQSATTIVSRSNLAPAPPNAPVPAPLRGHFGTYQPPPAANVTQARINQAQFGTTGPASVSTLGVFKQGLGGPGTPLGDFGTSLASLSPTTRTLIKVIPFVAAIFFWNKGDKVLAGVSAAAGGVAVVVL